MASTQVSTLLPVVRNRLIEPVATFWSDAELYDIMFQGIKNLWRDIVDLKQQHYITVENTLVSMPQSSGFLTGVPADVHKIFMIEPLNLTVNGTNHGLIFTPLKYNDDLFALARSKDPIDPTDDTIFYDIFQAGAPVGPPQVAVAPQVTSPVQLSFVYVPTLKPLTSSSTVPIPGEADNAIVAWTVAFARAKERDDRSPDPAWLAIFATEKQHLLQSLGLRQYQAPEYASAEFEQYW